MTTPKSLSRMLLAVAIVRSILAWCTHAVMKYKLTHCLQKLSRSHWLMYACSLGCTLKYWLAGWNCQLDLSKPPPVVLEVFQLPLYPLYPFKLAAIVEIGSNVDTEGCSGSTLAYIRSKNKVSKISSTTSIVPALPGRSLPIGIPKVAYNAAENETTTVFGRWLFADRTV